MKLQAWHPGLLALLSVCLCAVTHAAELQIPFPRTPDDPKWGDHKLSEWLVQLKTGDPLSRAQAAFTVASILDVLPKPPGLRQNCCVVEIIEGQKPPVYEHVGVVDALYIVPVLIEALADPEPGVQLGAGLALSYCEHHAAPAVPALANMVRNSRTLTAIIALGKIGAAAKPALPDLRLALNDEATRIEAAKALWRINREPGALGVLVDAFIWELADEELFQFFETEVGSTAQSEVPKLQKMLTVRRDRDIYKRDKALRLLGTIGPAAHDAVPALVEAYEQELTRGAREPQWLPIIETLGRIGPGAEAAVPLLIAMMRDRRVDDDARRKCFAAIKVLERIGPRSPQVIPALIESFVEPYSDRHFAAAAALRELGPAAKDAIPALLNLLHDKYYTDDVYSALGAIGPAAKAAADEMVAHLHDPNSSPHGTDERIYALGQIGSSARAAVPWLLAELDKLDHAERRNSERRSIIIEALYRIDQHPVAVAAAIEDFEARRLVPCLPVPFLPVSALPVPALLGEMGPKAAGALPRLRAMLHENNYHVRIAAADAIWKITADPTIVPFLETILRGYDPNAAVATAKLLWMIDQRPEAIEILSAARYRAHWDVVEDAERFLRSIGIEQWTIEIDRRFFILPR